MRLPPSSRCYGNVSRFSSVMIYIDREGWKNEFGMIDKVNRLGRRMGGEKGEKTYRVSSC